VCLTGKVEEPEIKGVIEKTVQAIVKIEKRPMLPFRDPGKLKGVDDIEVFARLTNSELDEVANL
jgi:hypothetical protein